MLKEVEKWCVKEYCGDECTIIDAYSTREQAAFENACEYIYYGYSKETWIKNEHNLGLSEKDSNEVWHEAFVSMSNQN